MIDSYRVTDIATYTTLAGHTRPSDRLVNVGHSDAFASRRPQNRRFRAAHLSSAELSRMSSVELLEVADILDVSLVPGKHILRLIRDRQAAVCKSLNRKGIA